jgi:hypothetical protein
MHFAIPVESYIITLSSFEISSYNGAAPCSAGTSHHSATRAFSRAQASTTTGNPRGTRSTSRARQASSSYSGVPACIPEERYNAIVLTLNFDALRDAGQRAGWPQVICS